MERKKVLRLKKKSQIKYFFPLSKNKIDIHTDIGRLELLWVSGVLVILIEMNLRTFPLESVEQKTILSLFI